MVVHFQSTGAGPYGEGTNWGSVRPSQKNFPRVVDKGVVTVL